MGHMVFGNLGVKVRGIITVRLSPYEQKAFAGVFKHGLPNMVRRVTEEIGYILPPLGFGYMFMNWADNYYIQQQRKNPDEVLCGAINSSE